MSPRNGPATFNYGLVDLSHFSLPHLAQSKVCLMFELLVPREKKFVLTIFISPITFSKVILCI